MNANDVIESYVTDVAVQLPRKQRNDVAYELRALLHEELQGKANAVGSGVDAAMAIELVRAFGRPVDVAARYRPTLTIIDPADGYAFARATVIGLGVVWALGLLMCLRQPIDSAWGLLLALRQWWGTTVIPSLWWPGLLVVSLGAASWARRRWPQTSEWKPRAADRMHGNRAAMVMGLVGTVCGVLVLIDPRRLLDLFYGGRAAPAAYDALTYTETFRQRQGPWLLALVALHVPMLITAIVHGRWPTTMRYTRSWQTLVTCAVLAWTAFDGPIVVAPSTDRMVKGVLVLVVAITLMGIGIQLYRSVRPAPNQRTRA
ncbi:MAG: hypothetical protein ACHQ52_08370 [Candidatus Eisenbacteria bacterium]